MGLLDFLSAPREVRVVTVAFRDPSRPGALDGFDPKFGYVYIWPFADEPRVGRWAIAEGVSGPATVVVGMVGATAQAQNRALKPLLSLIPQEQIDGPVHQWLESGRVAAGMPPSGTIKPAIPPGFDPFPPAFINPGTDAAAADRSGGIWWRAYKRSEELERDPVETATFKEIADAHYTIRNRGRAEARKVEKEVQTGKAAQLYASLGIAKLARVLDRRTPGEIESMMLAGLPMWDWLEYVKALAKESQEEDALAIAELLITAAEQDAAMTGREPAPAYTERAAIIHRSRRDYAAEIAVIKRWQAACPASRRGPGSTQAKLKQRLATARDLQAKAKAKK